MKESTYISARGYAMGLGKIFVYGCIAYALYSIATCTVCSSKSQEDTEDSKTTSELEKKSELEKRIQTTQKTPTATNPEDENISKRVREISDGIGDKINYAIDNVTDNVSGHIKKKADDATKPYIEPWKELGAEVGRYGRALRNDYSNGKLLKN